MNFFWLALLGTLFSCSTFAVSCGDAFEACTTQCNTNGTGGDETQKAALEGFNAKDTSPANLTKFAGFNQMGGRIAADRMVDCGDAKKQVNSSCDKKKSSERQKIKQCAAKHGKMNSRAAASAAQTPGNVSGANKSANQKSEGGKMPDMAGMAALAGVGALAKKMADAEKKAKEEAAKKEKEIRQLIEDEKAAAQAQQEMMKQEFEDRMTEMRDSVANQQSGLGCPVDFTSCQGSKTQACGPAGVAVCCSAADPSSGPLYPDQYNTDFCDAARVNAARQQSQMSSGVGGFGVPANGIAAGGAFPGAGQIPGYPGGGQIPSLPGGQIPNLPGGQIPTLPNGQMPDLGSLGGDVGSLGGNMPGGGIGGDLGRIPSNLPRPNFNIAKAKPAVQLGPISQNNFNTVSKIMCREYHSGQLIGTKGYGCAK